MTNRAFEIYYDNILYTQLVNADKLLPAPASVPIYSKCNTECAKKKTEERTPDWFLLCARGVRRSRNNVF